MRFSGKQLSTILIITIICITFSGCSKEKAPNNFNNSTSSSGSVPASSLISPPVSIQDSTAAGPPPLILSAPQISNPIAEKAAKAYFADLPDNGNIISEKDFLARIRIQDPGILTIDLRSKTEYDKAHVKGAVNIPFGMALSTALPKLPKDKTIYAYCETGEKAGAAIVLLQMAGYKAQSVNLGWNRGISKVPGYESLSEIKAADLNTQVFTTIDPQIKEAIEAFFKSMEAIKDTPWANFRISEDDTNRFLATKTSKIYLLDIRKESDFQKGSIAGALNQPFARDMGEKLCSLPNNNNMILVCYDTYHEIFYVDELPKDKKVIVICYTGQTAAQTAVVLKMLGFDAVWMNSGMGDKATAPAGWFNKNYPTLKNN